MKKIPLTQGQFALVDDEDFPLLSRFNWQYSKLRTNVYARTGIWDGKHQLTVRMHRMILGAPPEVKVDHINGNGLDNQRANLRLCSDSGNAQNARRRKDNTTGFKGVCLFKANGQFAARIQVNGKRIFLGYFDTAKEAAKAYNLAALEVHGEFACLNVIS